MAFATSHASCQCWHRLLATVAALLAGLAGAGATAEAAPAAAAAPRRRLPGLHRRGGIRSLDLSHINHTNLGGHGPDRGTPPTIRFKDVSTVAGTFLDLVIDSEGEYSPFDAKQNGHRGHIGIVNVKAGTKVDLNLKFVQTGLEIPAPMGRLYLTVFLLDQREKVKVKFFSSAATMAGFRRYCLSKGTLLKADVKEDPASITFAAPFGKSIEPRDPKDLSEAEQNQAVTFFLHGSFEIPISIEIAGGLMQDAGVNFAFAGHDSVSDSCHEWRPSSLAGATPSKRLASTTPASGAVERRRDAGCEKICKANGVSASCKARIDWVADNQYIDQANPCETAYSLVIDMCNICKSCHKEVACSAGYTAEGPRTKAVTTTTLEHHDCDEDFDTWTTSWSQEKQAWCCEKRDRACPTTVTATTTTVTTTATVTWTTQPYDCSAGLAASAWTKEHTAWCCEEYVIGCTATATTSTTPPTTTRTTTWTETSTTVTSTSSSTVTTQTDTSTSTTTERYDCEQNYSDWREAWDRDQQEFCCERHSRGCVPTTTEPFDCVHGFASWEASWTQRKKSYCCTHHKRGCPPTTTAPRCGSHACTTTTVTTTSTPEAFDCDEGFEDWATLWTYSKKAWCCQHHQRGCHFVAAVPTTTTEPYDCQEDDSSNHGFLAIGGFFLGSGSRAEDWSPERRQWCCGRYTVGCTTTGAPPPRQPDPYRCEGDSQGWDYRQKSWCCQHRGRGCTLSSHSTRAMSTSHPFDCRAGLDEWAMGWSDGKKEYCCRYYGQGCSSTQGPSEPFDCARGYLNWAIAWSYQKKAWCCRQYARGCHVSQARGEPFTCQGVSEEWSSSEKDYCCRVHGRGCATTTPELFDCSAGFSTWQIGWSSRKQQWCCRRYARGCGGLSPLRQTLVTADGTKDSDLRRQPDQRASPRTEGLFSAGGRSRSEDRGMRWPGLLAQALMAAAGALGVAAVLAALAARYSGRPSWRWLPLGEASTASRPLSPVRELCRRQNVDYVPVDRDVDRAALRAVLE